MAVSKSALGRSLTFWLVSSLIFNSIHRNPLNLEDKRLWICLEGFVVAKALCVPFLSLPRVQLRIKSPAIVPAPTSHKLLLGLKLLNVALFTNILVLCNDVASNPGPIDVTQSNLSSLEGSFSSPTEYSPSSTGTSFLSETDESDYSSSYFDLTLGENGLRIGHWNVNYLTTTKFEQIKLFLLGNMRSGHSQLDVLFISD